MIPIATGYCYIFRRTLQIHKDGISIWPANCPSTVEMTLPLEVIFCNMPPDQSLEAAAQDEVSLLESGRHLTSCRIRITLSKAVFSKSEYDVQIAVLAGPKLFCAEGDSPHRAPHQFRECLALDDPITFLG